MPQQVVRLNTNVPNGDVIKCVLPREGYDNISGDMRGVQKCNVCRKVFLYDSALAKHMKTHEMQRSQWHHCPYNDCDTKFKSKCDLNITLKPMRL